jgi:hypothetical protein
LWVCWGFDLSQLRRQAFIQSEGVVMSVLDILGQLSAPGQPERLYVALDREAKVRVGHGLFTLLYVVGNEVARVYSSRPAEYPLGGRKPMGNTPWGDLLIKQSKPYLGVDKAGIRWAFYDHALIESLGLGSVINIPVVYDGSTIGTMNLLDAEHHYREEHVALVEPLAPLLVPAFLEARRSAI